MDTTEQTQPSQELISAYTFAERKGVKNTAVYYRIHITKSIETVPVGKFNLIDWNRYKDVEFPFSTKLKSRIEKQATKLK